MTSGSTKTDGLQSETETDAHLFDSWFDPIEPSVRDRVRGFTEALSPSRREDGPASALSGPSFHLQATRPSALHRCTRGDCRLPRLPRQSATVTSPSGPSAFSDIIG
jgi:hypothetical protein